MFPRRALALAASLSLALVVLACGKSDLRSHQAATRTARTRPPTARASGAQAPPAIGETSVPLPLVLSPASAASFTHAVQLTGADLTGASAQPRSHSSRQDQEEASQCGSRPGRVVGGGRSADYARGRGLDREDISSGVAVLGSEATVHKDLEYTQSRAGLRCFSRIVTRKVAREAGGNVRLLGVRVSPLTIELPGAQRAAGLRIEARIAIAASRLEVQLYSDALTLPYGPAELDLYTTSFVQPAPARTEQQLLTLMRDRARLSRL